MDGCLGVWAFLHGKSSSCMSVVCIVYDLFSNETIQHLKSRAYVAARISTSEFAASILRLGHRLVWFDWLVLKFVNCIGFHLVSQWQDLGLNRWLIFQFVSQLLVILPDLQYVIRWRFVDVSVNTRIIGMMSGFAGGKCVWYPSLLALMTAEQ